MALGSLVDSPLPPLSQADPNNLIAGYTPPTGGTFNGMPLEGGFSGALEAPAPTYNELQGDDLVKSISMRMMQQDVKSPAFNAFASEVMKTKGYPTKTIQEYSALFPNNLITQNPLLGATMPSQEEGIPGASGSNTPLDPQADMPKILGAPLLPRSDDPIMQGYYDSEFFKPNRAVTADVVNYTYQGKPMQGSSSNLGYFQQYLDSIGKGDLIQRPNNMFAQTPGLQDLAKAEEQTPPGFGPPPTPTIPKLDGTVGFPVTVSGDDSIASTATVNPYQEQFTGFANQLTGFGDQLTGFGDQFGGLDKQFNTINTRLDNVDEGIASLSEQLQPQQQLYNSPYSNFNFSSNSYSNPSPFGLGSLFMRRY
jgi:hypothetical protein